MYQSQYLRRRERYAVYGYATSAEDLHMLDQMVFCIRRTRPARTPG